ncbi:mannosyl-3-phosphoglycerate phosphatase [Pleurocapsa sp. PCC 7319]|uniref:HAD-IIB family hydrolase n=1 Tax=Pleurocapsa sp. PCC 7319 TaxID=118161 RepID=UPI00034DA1F4|nr:HAD-IIB family hydrolase [Pleurocapsa sp. PCC 7319]
MRYIVVTDLDGTLLDHQTYEFTPALNAIAELSRQEIPIILNSSKTQAEILAIRRELENQEPFICENGGILCLSSDESSDSINSQGSTTQYLGVPRHQFLSSLDLIKEKLGLNYQGFAQSSVEDVVSWTGLTASDAHKAMQRQATEPLLWHDSEEALDTFRQELKKLALQCVKGGRFHHVMGLFNKASCFPQLKEYYSQHWQKEIGIIALGDSPNDLPMLEQADYAVVIPSAKGGNLQPNQSSVFFATQPGPHGWQEGIDFWLKSIH